MGKLDVKKAKRIKLRFPFFNVLRTFSISAKYITAAITDVEKSILSQALDLIFTVFRLS